MRERVLLNSRYYYFFSVSQL